MDTQRVLIIGQGFAGSLLAWTLIRRGVNITVADDQPEYSSTKVAAGIMLPVTGRRLAKTHLADRLVPFAQDTYRSIGENTGQTLFFEKDVLQVFTSLANRNEWYARSADTDMAAYCGPILTSMEMPPSLKNDFGAIVLRQSGYVDTRLFLSAVQAYIRQHGECIGMMADPGSLEVHKDFVAFQGKPYSHVIFCEGYRGMNNPYFGYLPFKPAKGEIIDITCEGLPADYIINTAVYILPMNNGLFRCGATYVWDDLSETPTGSGFEYLSGTLEKSIDCAFRVVGHQAGVRPSIRDRRPVIGFHPVYRRLGVFNGLGTKGALLGPYYARQMAELLMNDKQPDQDVDIRRFDALLPVT